MKEPKKKGRPRIEIDWSEMKKLCQILCTLDEISHWFKCSEDTIELRCKEEKGMLFTDYFKKHAAKGKISLRRSQMKSASTGNVTMQIWLGKQVLGQTDKHESKFEHSGPEGGPINIKKEMTPEEIEAELKRRGIPLPDIGCEDIKS